MKIKGQDIVCFSCMIFFVFLCGGMFYMYYYIIRLLFTEIAASFFWQNIYPYFDLAGETHRLWSSGKTPFPMGVGRNGKRVDSINLLTEFSALA